MRVRKQRSFVCPCGEPVTVRSDSPATTCFACSRKSAAEKIEHSLVEGQVFDKWTVRQRLDEKQGSSNLWLCQCSCGDFHKITATQLVLRKSRSCQKCAPKHLSIISGVCSKGHSIEKYGRLPGGRGTGNGACKGCVRDKYLQKTYGVTLAWYENKLEEQGGGCAICARPPKTKALAVDHNHRTGLVRGLLCMICNRKILGCIEKFRVCPQWVTVYLEKHDSANPLLHGEGWQVDIGRPPRKKRKK